MITLYHRTGAQDFDVLNNTLEKDDHEALMLNVRQILRARGEKAAVIYLERFPFRVVDGTNNFNDEFSLLIADLSLPDYEYFNSVVDDPDVKWAFQQIANVITEIGPYVRFIAVNLKRLSPETWDVFICHASEDKKDVVEPIYKHLESVGIRCWYDRGEILWGDTIIGKINEGLKSSQFVIVVLSNSLLKKKWAIKEMTVALSQEVNSGKTRVLPLMVGSDDDVLNIRSQLIIQEDKKYLRWSGDPSVIERELRAVIRRENMK